MILLASDQYDSILCALVTDVDFDGTCEIFLSTYGQVGDAVSQRAMQPPCWHRPPPTQLPRILSLLPQELLCYKYTSAAGNPPGKFRLLWAWHFPSLLLSMLCTNLTANGLCKLAIVCLKGLHVLQVSVTVSWWW